MNGGGRTRWKKDRTVKQRGGEGRQAPGAKRGKGAGYGYLPSFLCSTALLFGPLWLQLLSWGSANRRGLLRQSALNERRSGE